MRFVGNPKPPLILPSIFRPRISIIELRLKRQLRSHSVSRAAVPLYKRPRRYCHRGNQFRLKDTSVVIDSSANPRYRGCKWRFLETPVLSSGSLSVSLSSSILFTAKGHSHLTFHVAHSPSHLFLGLRRDLCKTCMQKPGRLSR
jgi:hypothetical protein